MKGEHAAYPDLETGQTLQRMGCSWGKWNRSTEHQGDGFFLCEGTIRYREWIRRVTGSRRGSEEADLSRNVWHTHHTSHKFILDLHSNKKVSAITPTLQRRLRV